MLKKLFATICILFACLMATNATVYTVDNLPVTTKGSQKFVCNPDGILSPTAISHIYDVCQKLEDSSSIQILVVAVDSIEPEDDYRFAEDLGNKYGVGSKKYNSGLVILLARKMGAIRFVTGTGLEGDLPDAICKRIQYQVMVPAFKEKKWDEGMTAGIDAIYSQLNGTNSFGAWDEDEDLELTTSDYIIIFLIFGAPLFVLLYSHWKKKQCPYCKGRMKLVESKTYRKGLIKTIKETYVCKNCGRTTTRSSSYSEKAAVSSGIGGGFGDSNWGGGFGGGGHSFGGGSFGGGGAGSRF